MKKVLVTGGLGYIGSHACIALFNEGYKPIIIDNLANSSFKVLDSIKTIYYLLFEMKKIQNFILDTSKYYLKITRNSLFIE